MRNKVAFLVIIGLITAGIIIVIWSGQKKTTTHNTTVTNINGTTKPTSTTADLFLVAVDDNGQTGTKIGCGDSLVPVKDIVTIPGKATDQQVADSITTVLTQLFAMHDLNYGQSGLYNALYRSNLTVDRVTYTSAAVEVALSGTLELGGECDNPRAEAEISHTITQFTNSIVPTITLNGQSLASALSLK